MEVFTEDFLKQVPDLPPGEIVSVVDRVVLPQGMPSGEYDLAVGIVGEHSTEPIVRLANKGRSDNGWYSLSKLLISG